MKKIPRHMHFPDRWLPPTPPQVELSASGVYDVSRVVPEHGTVRVTLAGGYPFAFGEDEGQTLGAILRGA